MSESSYSDIVKALELAEDVLSRAPMSTMIWPNGVHPQTGITAIRDALAFARASLQPATPTAGEDEWVEVTDGTTLPGDRFAYVPNPETGVGQITSHKRRATGGDAVAGDVQAAKHFYGAQCPTYPDCKGGCGLGCTHEVEQARVQAARAREDDDAESIEKISPQSIEITGPYLYVGDKHSSLRLAAPDRIVASIYVVDGDEDRAFAEAQMIKEAFRLGGKEIDRLHYASGVAQPKRDRDPFIGVIASLAAAISLLERTPNAKKAAPSDKMFEQMLTDYRKALEIGRSALSSTPGALPYQVPVDCRDEASCVRHGECMYLGCSAHTRPDRPVYADPDFKYNEATGSYHRVADRGGK